MLYAYSVKEPIGELNLKRALDEDTGPRVFSSFFSLLSSSSPLGQTAVSGKSTHIYYLPVIISITSYVGFALHGLVQLTPKTYMYKNTSHNRKSTHSTHLM